MACKQVGAKVLAAGPYVALGTVVLDHEACEPRRQAVAADGTVVMFPPIAGMGVFLIELWRRQLHIFDNRSGDLVHLVEVLGHFHMQHRGGGAAAAE